MTNFPDRDMRRYDYSPATGNTAMWVGGLIVVALVLGMLFYASSGPPRVNTAPDAIQHMSQPPAPAASPAEPSPTPKP